MLAEEQEHCMLRGKLLLLKWARYTMPMLKPFVSPANATEGGVK
jgi:hypothetical protein